MSARQNPDPYRATREIVDVGNTVLNLRGPDLRVIFNPAFVYTIEANTTLTKHISSKSTGYNIGYLLFNRTTVSRARRRGGGGGRTFELFAYKCSVSSGVH